jgi:hypothetical protein
MTAVERAGTERRVRVWFGEHVIVDQVCEPAFAARFERAMRQRFASLRITNEPVGLLASDGAG